MILITAKPSKVLSGDSRLAFNIRQCGHIPAWPDFSDDMPTLEDLAECYGEDELTRAEFEQSAIALFGSVERMEDELMWRECFPTACALLAQWELEDMIAECLAA